MPETLCFLDESHPVDLIIATEPSDEELALARDKQVELKCIAQAGYVPLKELN